MSYDTFIPYDYLLIIYIKLPSKSRCEHRQNSVKTALNFELQTLCVTLCHFQEFTAPATPSLKTTRRTFVISNYRPKLPYISNFSKLADIKIKTLCKNLCSEFKIKLFFSSFKIKKNFFTFKDPIPDALKSYFVYEFTCAGCNSRYVGESTRHFSLTT